MKQIKCELCGSSELLKENGMFICQHCGTKYSPEDAKKLFVSIDNSDQLQNLITLEKRAFEGKQYKEAYDYCLKILEIDPNNIEAMLDKACAFICKSTLNEINILSAKTNIDNLFTEIENSNIENKDVKLTESAQKILEYIDTVCLEYKINKMNSTMSKMSTGSISLDDLQEITKPTAEITLLPFVILSFEITDKYLKNDIEGKIKLLEEILYDTKKIMTKDVEINQIYQSQNELSIYQKYYPILKELKPTTEYKQIDSLDKLKEEKKASEKPQPKGGCYIATSVFNSYDCPEVWTLRRFRDNILASNLFGRLFIKTYYYISPILVKKFGKKIWFKNIWKKVLTHLIFNLNYKGIANTPYKDKNWY